MSRVQNFTRQTDRQTDKTDCLTPLHMHTHRVMSYNVLLQIWELQTEYGSFVASYPSCYTPLQASQSSGASSTSQTKGAQGASTSTSGQAQGGSTTSAHQPVEFNHAINYVNKIKVRGLLLIAPVCVVSFFYFPFLLFYCLPFPFPFSFLSSPLISLFVFFIPILFSFFFPSLLFPLLCSLLPSLSFPLTESFPASPRHLQGISRDLAHLSKGAASHQGRWNS